jgi:hypothetical protein
MNIIAIWAKTGTKIEFIFWELDALAKVKTLKKMIPISHRQS